MRGGTDSLALTPPRDIRSNLYKGRKSDILGYNVGFMELMLEILEKIAFSVTTI